MIEKDPWCWPYTQTHKIHKILLWKLTYFHIPRPTSNNIIYILIHTRIQMASYKSFKTNQSSLFPPPFPLRIRPATLNFVLKPHYIECVLSDSSIMSHCPSPEYFYIQLMIELPCQNYEHKQSGCSHSSKRGAWELWINPLNAGEGHESESLRSQSKPHVG